MLAIKTKIKSQHYLFVLNVREIFMGNTGLPLCQELSDRSIFCKVHKATLILKAIPYKLSLDGHYWR